MHRVLGCHACRASAHLRGVHRTPPASAYQRCLICPLSMGCDHMYCVCGPVTHFGLKLAGVISHTPSYPLPSTMRAGLVAAVVALPGLLAQCSSDCASFSRVLMGKLLLVQVSRGKGSRLFLSEVELRRAPPSPDGLTLQIISSHGRLFWLSSDQGTSMKGPEIAFCIWDVEMEAERPLQLKYHPTRPSPD